MWFNLDSNQFMPSNTSIGNLLQNYPSLKQQPYSSKVKMLNTGLYAKKRTRNPTIYIKIPNSHHFSHYPYTSIHHQMESTVLWTLRWCSRGAPTVNVSTRANCRLENQIIIRRHSRKLNHKLAYGWRRVRG